MYKVQTMPNIVPSRKHNHSDCRPFLQWFDDEHSENRHHHSIEVQVYHHIGGQRLVIYIFYHIATSFCTRYAQYKKQTARSTRHQWKSNCGRGAISTCLSELWTWCTHTLRQRKMAAAKEAHTKPNLCATSPASHIRRSTRFLGTKPDSNAVGAHSWDFSFEVIVGHDMFSNLGFNWGCFINTCWKLLKMITNIIMKLMHIACEVVLPRCCECSLSVQLLTVASPMSNPLFKFINTWTMLESSLPMGRVCFSDTSHTASKATKYLS